MLDTIAMAEKLTGDYRKVFEKADMYSTLSSESADTDDEKMMNLYDLLLEAQSNDKPVEKIIGTDIETFCKEYFKVDKDELEKWYIRIPKVLYIVTLWITIITLFGVIFPEEGQTLQTTTTDIFPYLAGVFIGFVTAIIMKYVLKPLIFKSKKMKPITFYFIYLALFIGSIILTIILIGDAEIMNIPAIWLLTICGGYVVIYLLVRSLWRYRTYGTIRKNTKENREHKKEEKKVKKDFNDEISDKSIAKAMAKRYARLNKRNLKRKQQELPFTEFAEIIRKEERMTGKVNIIMAFVFAALVIFPAVIEMVTTGFIDGLILGSILTIVETCIYCFFKSCNDSSVKQQLHIIEKCERLGVNIVEYANNKFI